MELGSDIGLVRTRTLLDTTDLNCSEGTIELLTLKLTSGDLMTVMDSVVNDSRF